MVGTAQIKAFIRGSGRDLEHRSNESPSVGRIRQLVWAYFFLLIFEGALRKWVVPSLATPLLLVRDPIAIAIYYYAVQIKIFPRNYFMVFGVPLAILCFSISLFLPGSSPSVAVFGFHANFLHLPLIFIIPRVFNLNDVREMGRWTLWLSLPLSLLMVVQFRSSPDSWINAGTEGNFQQIESAMGHIRAPATFSFISGPVFFYSLAAAFLFWGEFTKRQYPLHLLLVSAVALLSASVVSGSRALVIGVAVVFICASLAASAIRPWLIFRWLWTMSIAAVLVYGLSNIQYFQEGAEVFSIRVEGSRAAEGGDIGMIGRFTSSFTDALPLFTQAPILGYGLGMGTNAGAALLTGEVSYLLAENEWARVLLESGPLLGGAFLLLRITLCGWIGFQAIHQAIKGNPLPILLFGVCGLLVLNGQWGQTTSLGFTVLSSGLCLAAFGSEKVKSAGQFRFGSFVNKTSSSRHRSVPPVFSGHKW